MIDINDSNQGIVYPALSPNYKPRRCRECGRILDCCYAILCDECKGDWILLEDWKND